MDVFEGDFTRTLGAFWRRRGGGGGFGGEGSLNADLETGLADVRSMRARPRDCRTSRGGWFGFNAYYASEAGEGLRSHFCLL